MSNKHKNKENEIKGATSEMQEQASFAETPKTKTASKKETKEVPPGWVIVSIQQNGVKVHDFLKKGDVKQTLLNVEKIKGTKPEVLVAYEEGEQYDPSIVGEQDPEKLAHIKGVSVKELNAISGCSNC